MPSALSATKIDPDNDAARKKITLKIEAVNYSKFMEGYFLRIKLTKLTSQDRLPMRNFCNFDRGPKKLVFQTENLNKFDSSIQKF